MEKMEMDRTCSDNARLGMDTGRMTVRGKTRGGLAKNHGAGETCNGFEPTRKAANTAADRVTWRETE